MKQLVFGLVLICLGGCIAAPAKPPTGCENAMVWTSGFMPEGRDLVELGFAALLAAEPKFKAQVKAGALQGWRVVKAGTVKGAVAELLPLLEKNPQYAPLALFALMRLDLDRTLDACDQEVLLSMLRNIAVYAGATEPDFSDSLAELGSTPAAKDK